MSDTKIKGNDGKYVGNGKLQKTTELIKKYEKGVWDYNDSANAQVEIIDCLLGESGNSGFSASWVIMKTIEKCLLIDGPFRIDQPFDLLYPQYDYRNIAFLENSFIQVKKQADKLLKENSKTGHPNVIKRWTEISEMKTPDELVTLYMKTLVRLSP